MSLMDAISAMITNHIEAAFARRMSHRIGVVSSYDPKTHSVKLMRQPEGIETGFIPLPSHSIGNGWGIVTGPNVGDQFILGFIGGDVEVPFIAGRLFSDQETPPSVQSGEIVIKHQSGSSITMSASGGVTHTSAQALNMTGGAGMTLTASGSGNLA